ncbi:MAG: SPOR domain-containing protein [Actinotalea sp.]|nr:SPOR domain-containing protein [Actinotalea sp.]
MQRHDDSAERFWFNPRTGEVEEGKESPWTDRMGPYATREEAQAALAEAQRRTESWDEEDRRWKEWED